MYEFEELLDLLSDYIECLADLEIRDSAVDKIAIDTHRLFVEGIVECLYEAKDCLLDGYFNASKALIRTALENYVLLSAMSKYPDNKLEQLWQIHSLIKLGRKVGTDRLKLSKEEVCTIWEIDEERVNWKALNTDYGWLYPIFEDGRINMKRICSLLDYPKVYEDYAVLSEAVHGSASYQKGYHYTFQGAFLWIIAALYEYSERVAREWCEITLEFEALSGDLIYLLQVEHEAKNNNC